MNSAPLIAVIKSIVAHTPFVRPPITSIQVKPVAKWIEITFKDSVLKIQHFQDAPVTTTRRDGDKTVKELRETPAHYEVSWGSNSITLMLARIDCSDSGFFELEMLWNTMSKEAIAKYEAELSKIVGQLAAEPSKEAKDAWTIKEPPPAPERPALTAVLTSKKPKPKSDEAGGTA